MKSGVKISYASKYSRKQWLYLSWTGSRKHILSVFDRPSRQQLTDRGYLDANGAVHGFIALSEKLSFEYRFLLDSFLGFQLKCIKIQGPCLVQIESAQMHCDRGLQLLMLPVKRNAKLNTEFDLSLVEAQKK